MICFLLENINHELSSFEIYEIVAFDHRFLSCCALVRHFAHESDWSVFNCRCWFFRVYQAAVLVQSSQNNRFFIIIAPHLFRVIHRFDLFHIINFFQFMFDRIFKFLQSYLGSACGIIQTCLFAVIFWLGHRFIVPVLIIDKLGFHRLLFDYGFHGFLFIVGYVLFWSFVVQFYLLIIFKVVVIWFRFDCSLGKDPSLLHFFSFREI